MYTALALMIVVGISFLMTLVGLSPALGAFLAGVVLASSEFRHEMESDLEPFKGLLLGLFFITVGAGTDVGYFFNDPFDLIGLALLVILVKGLILYAVGRAFKLRGRDHWLFTLGLAQAGEFGFVLLAFSTKQNVIPPALSQKLLMIIALTMLITPLLFIIYDYLSRHIRDNSPEVEPEEIDEKGPVIIAGIGRFGQIVNRLVRASGFKTVVLDHNIETIQLMRRFGVKGFLGDPTRPELLRAAGLEKASVLVAAMDNRKEVTRLVGYARRQRPDLHIVARAHDRTHVYELYQAGADDIVREMFDSSLRAGRYVLENIGLSEYEAAQAQQTFYHHDRQAIRELAELWVPGMPTAENKSTSHARASWRRTWKPRCWNWPKRTKRNQPDPGISRVSRAQPSDTPASAKVAMPEWQATALFRMLMASAAPDPSPSRSPRLSKGALSSLVSMAACAPSAL